MSKNSEPEKLQEAYALIWKANETNEKADEAFQERIPRIMDWLKSLKQTGHLLACGGGGFEGPAGGLTIIRADSPEHAIKLDKNPLNEIGKTELFLWDIFHADLQTNLNVFESK